MDIHYTMRRNTIAWAGEALEGPFSSSLETQRKRLVERISAAPIVHLEKIQPGTQGEAHRRTLY